MGVQVFCCDMFVWALVMWGLFRRDSYIMDSLTKWIVSYWGFSAETTGKKTHTHTQGASMICSNVIHSSMRPAHAHVSINTHAHTRTHTGILII